MTSKTNDKTKGTQTLTEINQEKTEINNFPETPLKRPPLYLNNVYSILSPLPFPPRIDAPSQDLFGHNPNELRYVETPVVKDHSKFLPIQQEEAIGYDIGIVSKIIFESSQEDGPINSSSMESSSGSEQELSQNSEPAPSEQPQSSFSQIQHPQHEDISGHSGTENDKESKNRRNSKPRTNLTLSKEVNPNKKVFCNCKKTKCLKLYCDCFRLNQTCDGCNCVGCHNLDIYSDERNNAILSLMDRNPDPFGQKIQDDKHVKGCNCKKSNCQKKYCECYQAGLKCGQNCKCQECKNMPSEKGQPQGDRATFLVKNTAKKQRRMVQI